MMIKIKKLIEVAEGKITSKDGNVIIIEPKENIVFIYSTKAYKICTQIIAETIVKAREILEKIEEKIQIIEEREKRPLEKLKEIK